MRNVSPARKWRAFATTALCSAAFAPMLLASNVVLAQDTDQAQDGQPVDQIVITGSRIIRRDIDAPNPVNVINDVDIRDSGETDIAKLLREIPALNGSLTATGSVNTGFGSDLNDDTGVGRLNLRNLGTNRTLVLVNGRRHVSAIQGSADVDVSTIPIALIERVETATGGGSAVYGADAVSGVINFILRDDFEGLDYRAQYSLSNSGDAGNIFVALTGGVNFDDDRGNAVLSVEYTRQSRVNSNERNSQIQEGFLSLIANSDALATALGRDPNAENVLVPDFRINFSSSSGILAVREAGSFGSVFGGLVDGDNDDGIIMGVPALQVFRDGVFRPFDRGIQSNPFEASGGDGIEAFNPNSAIVPYIDKINVNGLFRYKLTDGIEFYGETKFVLADTQDAGGIPFNDDIPIALDNPFLPAGLRAQIDAIQAGGTTPQITMSRDILDAGVIGQSDTRRTTLRLVGGLRGEFENGWRWDVSYNYGRTEINTTNVNSRVEDRFFAGVDAVVDPETGEIVCRSDLDPSALPPGSPLPTNRPGFLTFDAGDGQCIPINLFGTDSITAESGAFAFIDTFETSTIEQRQLLATLTGDSAGLFELPGGPVGFAVGFEYRDEESSFTPPELERAGLLYNTSNEARGIVRGSYDVKEFFGEVSLPILEGVAFVESLILDGSFRYTDHSAAGSIETYGGGLNWQMDSNIRVRATYNRAIRAPNIFELFSPAQPAFLGVTADPCAPQNINAGTPNRATNCAMFVAPGFDPANFLSARIAGTTGGNDGLKEETADTFTVGLVLTPQFIPGLSITVDYYSIKIDDAIGSLSGAQIAELCVDLPNINNPFCAAITRDPSRGNAIVDFTSGNVNLTGFSTEGLDILVNYQLELSDLFDGDFGQLDQTIVANHVFNNISFPDPLDPDFALPAQGQFGIPTWIVNYQARWSNGDFSMTWQTRFQNSQLIGGVANEDVVGNPNFADPLKTGNAFVHDVSGTYQLNDYANFTVGVNNLANRKPFLGSRTRPVDPIGRTFFFNVQGTF